MTFIIIIIMITISIDTEKYWFEKQTKNYVDEVLYNDTSKPQIVDRFLFTFFFRFLFFAQPLPMNILHCHNCWQLFDIIYVTEKKRSIENKRDVVENGNIEKWLNKYTQNYREIILTNQRRKKKSEKYEYYDEM